MHIFSVGTEKFLYRHITKSVLFVPDFGDFASYVPQKRLLTVKLVSTEAAVLAIEFQPTCSPSPGKFCGHSGSNTFTVDPFPTAKTKNRFSILTIPCTNTAGILLLKAKLFACFCHDESLAIVKDYPV